MTIAVCPLSRVPDRIRALRPARVISLLDPYTRFPDTGYGERHLRVTMHDIVADAPGALAPTQAHIEQILTFIEGWNGDAPLLEHCFAGISRSSATAFIAACLHNPRADEHAIAVALRAASANARPNGRMIDLADIVLGRNGRMSAALHETGRELPWLDIQENDPFSIPSVFEATR